MLTLIAALDRDRAIGLGNAMPWRLPDDFARFKARTLGRTVLMGHRTAVSVGRPLPDRVNLVLSRHRDAPYAGQVTVRSLDEALAHGDLMIAGGGEVYAMTLPLADRLDLTWVDTRLPAADTWFPALPDGEWTETGREHHAADVRHAYAFDWVDYVRTRVPHGGVVR
jgi:dihydrofolate reductase